jgi:hypothetical protein
VRGLQRLACGLTASDPVDLLAHRAQRHCCIKAKGVLAVPQSGDAGPSDTLENHNKPGI